MRSNFPGAYPPGYADDRAQIEDLLGRYAFAIDFFDADMYAATFAPDGVLIYAGGVERGRDAIRDFLKAHGESARAAGGPARPARRAHNIMNLVLDVDGERAKGAAYWTMVSNHTDYRHSLLGGFGHSQDDYVKIGGQWLFAKREIFNEVLEHRAAAGHENPLRQPVDLPAPPQRPR